jgi:hypothetical protein
MSQTLQSYVNGQIACVMLNNSLQILIISDRLRSKLCGISLQLTGSFNNPHVIVLATPNSFSNNFSSLEQRTHETVQSS